MSRIPEYSSNIARIGSVLALLGSLIWVQWPVRFEDFNIAAIVILIGSFVTWVSTEASSLHERKGHNDNILSDDVEKLNALLRIIDSNQFYIIKNLPIQTYMDSDSFDGLRDLTYYKDNDIFGFHSKNIQRKYIDFAELAEDFLMEFWNLYTSDGQGRATWRPIGNQYVPQDIYDEVQNKITALNAKLSGLSQQWIDLIVVARSELRGASKTIEQYDL